MAQYRLYKGSEGKYNLSGSLMVGDELVAFLTRTRLSKQDLPAAATEMASAIHKRRLAYRAVRDAASKAGVPG